MFSKAFGPLSVCNLIMALLTTLLAVVLIVPWVAGLIWTYRNGTPAFPGIPVILGIAACSVPIIYISVAWAFGFALVMDKGLSPWTALEVSRRVVSKQCFRFAAALILGTLLAMLGLVGFIVGVLFTLPVLFGTLTYAYEDLFNPVP